MFKKLVAVATTTALTVAMAVTAFAAVGINDAEQKILDELKAKGVDAQYIAMAEKELSADGVDVTADAAKTAIANIDEAKKIVDEAGIKSVAELKKNTTVLNKVASLVESTGTTVGVKVTVSVKDGKVTYTSPNYSGSAELEKTGVDFSTTAAVVAGLGLSVAGIAVIAKKKDLVNA
ncbi:MAG: LPXTG cell wall anchor domain-containing protein [Lachnospiraceae bacterium]|nr:LPXTG cell wall anchor domain-containing protein [Lachnospiraceae bacterium]